MDENSGAGQFSAGSGVFFWFPLREQLTESLSYTIQSWKQSADESQGHCETLPYRY
jgi:hypothetical protein